MTLPISSISFDLAAATQYLAAKDDRPPS